MAARFCLYQKITRKDECRISHHLKWAVAPVNNKYSGGERIGAKRVCLCLLFEISWMSWVSFYFYFKKWLTSLCTFALFWIWDDHYLCPFHSVKYQKEQGLRGSYRSWYVSIVCFAMNLAWDFVVVPFMLLLKWVMKLVLQNPIVPDRFEKSFWSHRSWNLLHELDKFGLRGEANDWCGSYLDNRRREYFHRMNKIQVNCLILAAFHKDVS